MKRKVIASLSALLMLMSVIHVKPSMAEVQTQRISGADRYETAVNLSKKRFNSGVPVVYLATGHQYPDALTAVPVAGKLRGPVLLVRGNAMPPTVAQELARLKPQRIVILGGPAVVSTAVETAAKRYSTRVERLYGADRYETAVKLSSSAFGAGVPVAFVATGTNFPDALAVGPAAIRLGGPVLLTKPTVLPAAVKQELQRLKPKKIVVLGGPSVVSNAVTDELASIAPVERWYGADRYATATIVVQKAFGTNIASVYVATGRDFPDALAAGTVAGLSGSPILLVNGDLPDAVRNCLGQLPVSELVVVGGTGAVPDTVVSNIQLNTKPVKDSEQTLTDKNVKPDKNPSPAPQQSLVNENPAYNPDYPESEQWINTTRISPALRMTISSLQQKVANGTATPKEKHLARFKVEELLWNYYTGPIPASPYEAEAMERIPRLYGYDRSGKTSWNDLSEYDKAIIGSLAWFGSKNVMLHEYGFTPDGKLEWFIVRPVGMRHAFKITIQNPIGSVIKNMGWAGMPDEAFDGVYAELTTPKLLEAIRQAKVPVEFNPNQSLYDKWKLYGLPEKADPNDFSIHAVEIVRRDNPHYVVRQLYGGDFAFLIGGDTFYLSHKDVGPGSKLIPPEFLMRKPYQRGTAQPLEIVWYNGLD